MNVEIMKIRVMGVQDHDVERYYSITLSIEGKRIKYSGGALTFQSALEDAYFYATGKRIQWQETLDQRSEPVFTDEAADPSLFTHLERVPPWVDQTF